MPRKWRIKKKKNRRECNIHSLLYKKILIFNTWCKSFLFTREKDSSFFDNISKNNENIIKFSMLIHPANIIIIFGIYTLYSESPENIINFLVVKYDEKVWKANIWIQFFTPRVKLVFSRANYYLYLRTLASNVSRRSADINLGNYVIREISKPRWYGSI